MRQPSPVLLPSERSPDNRAAQQEEGEEPAGK